jgi:hypothetical protein
MIQFKKVETSERKRGDAKEYRYECEVTGIKPMGGGKAMPMDKPKGKSFSEALDEVTAGGESGEDEMPGTMDD